MAVSEKIVLDRADARILVELQQVSSISNVEFARREGLSIRRPLDPASRCLHSSAQMPTSQIGLMRSLST